MPLPNTPPYRLAGRVSRHGRRYEMTGLGGRVGDSDIDGQFTVTQQNDRRPFFDGDFHSRSKFDLGEHRFEAGIVARIAALLNQPREIVGRYPQVVRDQIVAQSNFVNRTAVAGSP